MYWFKKHPEHFRKESAELATNPNYKQIGDARDESYISHGFIITRLEKSRRYPVLIVYPPGTPYLLPQVFPLNRELTKDECTVLAAQKEPCPPKDAIAYYHQLRHQNHTGNLCFLEWDGLDEGSRFFGIGAVLQRITEWYKGHITGDFPPDSEEVEFWSHFTNLSNSLHLLYPPSFVDDDSVAGEFYAAQYFNVPKELADSPMAALNLGCYLTGINAGGIAQPPKKLHLPSWATHEGLENGIDIQAKPAIVKRLSEDGRLKEGIWFSIKEEPRPFKEFADLLTIIGEGSADDGLNRIRSIAFERIKKLPQEILVSIRFPNRRGEQEFQVFIVHKDGEAAALPLFCDPMDTMKVAVSAYKTVYAVKCEKFSQETFFQRNASRADRAILGNQTVTFLGVGALGSEIADSLAKAGIGSAVLVDNQLLGVQNTMRHVAGLNDISKPKVMAVAAILKSHNPFLGDIQQIGHNITEPGVFQSLPDDSIFVSSIADDNTEGYINEMAVEAGRTVFYTRALRGGKAARIVRVVPGHDACLNCLRLYRTEVGNTIHVPADPSLPAIRNECNNPVLPASAADLKLAASLTSRIVIDYMQGDKKETEANHWIWTSEAIPETTFTEAFKLHPQRLIPHPNCQICSEGHDIVMHVDSEVLQKMQEKVVSKAGIETGGVLAGYRTETGEVFITYASEAGPKAVESANRFEKDVEFCQQFLNDLLQRYGGKIIYLGEWHSHPNENNSPSATDISSLLAISQQKEYLTDKPIMIIFTKSGNPSCTVHPTGKLHFKAKLKIDG